MISVRYLNGLTERFIQKIKFYFEYIRQGNHLTGVGALRLAQSSISFGLSCFEKHNFYFLFFPTANLKVDWQLHKWYCTLPLYVNFPVSGFWMSGIQTSGIRMLNWISLILLTSSVFFFFFSLQINFDCQVWI